MIYGKHERQLDGSGREIRISDHELKNILLDRGVLSRVDNSQVRALKRDDIEKLIEANGGVAEYLDLSQLDMTEIDLRGLDLTKVTLNGCNLTRAIAMPLIVQKGGNELKPSDLAYEHSLDNWYKGEKSILGYRFYPTRLTDSSGQQVNFSEANLMGADFSKATITWFNFHRASIPRTNFENATLTRSDLSDAIAVGANFASAKLHSIRSTGTDFRDSTFAKAELNGTHFDTPLITGIEWGDFTELPEIISGDFEEGRRVLGEIQRALEYAFEHNIAGEVHYVREIAARKSIGQQFISRSKRNSSWPILALSSVLHGGFRLGVRWLLAKGAELVFGYGERPLRVVATSAFLVIAFTAAYCRGTGWKFTSEGLANFGTQSIDAVYFSAISFSALGYGEWVNEPAGWTRYLGALESFFGVSLIALLIITLTRKWLR